MDEVAPFSEEESAELRAAGRTIIHGEIVTRPVEEAVHKWQGLVRLFLLVVDRDNGQLGALPYSGGLLDQPWKTMQAFELLQVVFCEKLAEEMKKAER